jgi:hypothetical protein
MLQYVQFGSRNGCEDMLASISLSNIWCTNAGFCFCPHCPGLSPKCFKCKIHHKQKRCCTIAHISPHKNICKHVRNCHVSRQNSLLASVRKNKTSKTKFSFASKCVTNIANLYFVSMAYNGHLRSYKC